MTKYWNWKLFRDTVAIAAEEKALSKEQLFEELASKLHISARVVKAYQAPGSKGPSSARASEMLQEYFGVSFTIYDPEAEQLRNHLSGTERLPVCSDFSKGHILEALNIIRRFLYCDHILEDDGFFELVFAVAEHTPAIPNSFNAKIMDFVENNLKPLVFDTDNAFSSCRVGTGHEDENGVFVVEDSDAFFTAMVAVYDKTCKEFQRLTEELSPVLTQ